MDKIIHDLTTTEDFTESMTHFIFDSINIENDLPYFKNNDSNVSWDEDELVFTGTWFDRQNKRFMNDYGKEKNLCDRCGSEIRIKPWDFEYTGKLCANCEKELDNETKNNFIIFINKSWNFTDERENLLENPLLWD